MPITGTHLSDPDSSFVTVETFTFTEQTSFNTIVWYGVYDSTTLPGPDPDPPQTFSVPDSTFDNFTISLYNTIGGTPSDTPFDTFSVGNTATRVVTSITAFNNTPVFQYTFVLPSSATLGAGTYALGIFNDNTADNILWGWSDSSTSGSHFFDFLSDEIGYSTTSGEMAFRLENNASAAAPEPGTFALFGIGGLALMGGLVTRRKNRKK
ncbi:MAG: hypothetical protein OHK0029_19240 [Armatimonadaceae bacterium]